MAAEVRVAVGTRVCSNDRLSWSRIKPSITLPIYSFLHRFTPVGLVETRGNANGVSATKHGARTVK